MAGANEITAYLLLHLSKELPVDVWRSKRVDAMAVGAGGRMRRVQAGVDGQADLCGLAGPSGRMLQLECKAPGDTWRQTQKDFAARVERMGGVYLICWVKQPSTIAEIRDRLSLRRGAPVQHPAEIRAFFDALRARLEGR